MSYKSYYLYQKYQSIGGGTPTPVYPEEFSVDGDGTMPKVIKDENDVNCGAPSSGDTIYRWVDIPISSDYICDVCPTPTPTYQWVTTTGYTCSGTTKMSREKEQVSYDSGSTWSDTGQYRAGSTVLAYNSEDCGYVPPAPTDYSTQYLTFESECDNVSIYFGVASTQTASAKTISASTDNGATWTAYTATSEWTQIATLDTGEKVLVKGENGTYYHNRFDSYDGTQHYKVYGNIMSLISGDSFASATTFSTTYAFANLFYDSGGLTDAENLILPATTLANYCYTSMFYRCPSLTKAPALPATTLAESCYESMFADCTSLTTAPVLSATTLADFCYNSMFARCTNLNYIKCLATDISASNCTSGWVYGGVAATGTFVKNSSMTGWTTGVSGIPSGWTVQNA